MNAPIGRFAPNNPFLNVDGTPKSVNAKQEPANTLPSRPTPPEQQRPQFRAGRGVWDNLYDIPNNPKESQPQVDILAELQKLQSEVDGTLNSKLAATRTSPKKSKPQVDILAELQKLRGEVEDLKSQLAQESRQHPANFPQSYRGNSSSYAGYQGPFPRSENPAGHRYNYPLASAPNAAPERTKNQAELRQHILSTLAPKKTGSHLVSMPNLSGRRDPHIGNVTVDRSAILDYVKNTNRYGQVPTVDGYRSYLNGRAEVMHFQGDGTWPDLNKYPNLKRNLEDTAIQSEFKLIEKAIKKEMKRQQAFRAVASPPASQYAARHSPDAWREEPPRPPRFASPPYPGDDEFPMGYLGWTSNRGPSTYSQSNNNWHSNNRHSMGQSRYARPAVQPQVGHNYSTARSKALSNLLKEYGPGSTVSIDPAMYKGGNGRTWGELDRRGMISFNVNFITVLETMARDPETQPAVLYNLVNKTATDLEIEPEVGGNPTGDEILEAIEPQLKEIMKYANKLLEEEMAKPQQLSGRRDSGYWSG